MLQVKYKLSSNDSILLIVIGNNFNSYSISVCIMKQQQKKYVDRKALKMEVYGVIDFHFKG